jgi:hypothetical protein
LDCSPLSSLMVTAAATTPSACRAHLLFLLASRVSFPRPSVIDDLTKEGTDMECLNCTGSTLRTAERCCRSETCGVADGLKAPCTAMEAIAMHQRRRLCVYLHSLFASKLETKIRPEYESIMRSRRLAQIKSKQGLRENELLACRMI